jgi:hypothetical protein
MADMCREPSTLAARPRQVLNATATIVGSPLFGIEINNDDYRSPVGPNQEARAEMKG